MKKPDPYGGEERGREKMEGEGEVGWHSLGRSVSSHMFSPYSSLMGGHNHLKIYKDSD